MKASERISQLHGELEATVNEGLAKEGHPPVEHRSLGSVLLLLRAVIDYLDEIPPSEGAK